MTTMFTLADYKALAKVQVSFVKTMTTGAALSTDVIWTGWPDAGGDPAAGSLAIGNTTTGVVPTNATTGAATIPVAFASSGGYLTRLEGMSQNWNMTFQFYDRLFHAGAFAFNASATLSSQPSYSGRLPFMPDGVTVDYKGLQLWVEQASNGTGVQNVAVTYTNQDGVSGRTTGTVAAPAQLIANAAWKLPLQAGDSGVQKIESVTGTTASAGTFTVVVARPLCRFVTQWPNRPQSFGMETIGAPLVFPSSCFAVMHSTRNFGGTVTGGDYSAMLEIAATY